jgi:hypothetical protein
MWRLVLAAVLVGHVASAYADDPRESESKPWAAGVSADAQARALEIFRAANAQFLESQYAPALVQYREALAIWDHPAIHFNIAVCLMNLDQPLEALEHLEQAMRWGESGLAEGLYTQGVTFKKLLEGRLATLRVDSAGHGAEVLLDGKVMFVAPGSTTLRVLPGAHQLVARQAGMATTTRELTLVGGTTTTESIDVARLAVVTTRYERKWKSRTPWLVAAAGVAATAGGVTLLLLGRSNLASYQDYVDLHCPDGCAPMTIAPSVYARHDRGEIQVWTGTPLAAVGGAAIVTGIVMLLLNEPRKVAPVITPGTAGAMLHLEF